jgi:hypothetical protein
MTVMGATLWLELRSAMVGGGDIDLANPDWSGWLVTTPRIPQINTTSAAGYNRYFGPRINTPRTSSPAPTSIVPEQDSIIENLILKPAAALLSSLSDGKG